MLKFKKIIIIVLVLGLISGVVVYLNVFYFPKLKRDLTEESAKAVLASELVNTYSENESKADSLYRNQVLDVSGTVIDVKQDSVQYITLKSADPFSSVYICCDASQKNSIAIGDSVTMRGICIGYLSDVQLNAGVLIQTIKK